MNTTIDINNLGEWCKDEKIENAYLGQFSMDEKVSSYDRREEVTDANYDARRTLQTLAKMVDHGNTRAFIQDKEPRSHRLLVDVIAIDGVVARTLKNGDPMMFIRVSFCTEGDANEDQLCRYLKAQHTGMSLSSASDQLLITHAWCLSGPPGVDVLANEFEANSEMINPATLSYIEKNLPKYLLEVPNSYTSFAKPMYIPTSKKEVEKCRRCTKPGISICSRCKVARYCSKECQAADWKAGHKTACEAAERKGLSAREFAESDSPLPWVDIDERVNSITVNQISMKPCNVGYTYKTNQVKKAGKMKLYKVQNSKSFGFLGFSPDASILIYSQGRKDMFNCTPESISGGMVTFRKLYNQIENKGIPSGVDLSFKKAYFSGYITPEGKLRLLLHKMHSLQPW